MNLDHYSTLIFDCDGVILNSNKIKTESFYEVTYTISIEAAIDLVNYHKRNGGISRYKKFNYFQEKIINKYFPNKTLNIQELLESYSKEVMRNLLKCEIAKGLKELNDCYKNKKWIVVSGSDEKELNNVLNKRGISNFFCGGIYGSPDSKEKIFKKLIENKIIEFPALYIGDSKYDYLASRKFNIDFIFLYSWTEFNDWRKFIKDNKICFFKDLNEIYKILKD